MDAARSTVCAVEILREFDVARASEEVTEQVTSTATNPNLMWDPAKKIKESLLLEQRLREVIRFDSGVDCDVTGL